MPVCFFTNKLFNYARIGRKKKNENFIHKKAPPKSDGAFDILYINVSICLAHDILLLDGFKTSVATPVIILPVTK